MSMRQEELFSTYLVNLKNVWEKEMLYREQQARSRGEAVDIDRSDTAFAQDFLGTTNKSYSEWKRAVRLPNDDNLRRAAAAVNDLFGRRMADQMFLAAGRQPQFVTNDAKLREMLAHWDELTEAEQDRQLEEMRETLKNRSNQGSQQPAFA